MKEGVRGVMPFLPVMAVVKARRRTARDVPSPRSTASFPRLRRYVGRNRGRDASTKPGNASPKRMQNSSWSRHRSSVHEFTSCAFRRKGRRREREHVCVYQRLTALHGPRSRGGRTRHCMARATLHSASFGSRLSL